MRPSRGEVVLLVVLAVGAMMLQGPLREWWVEDAAISFAYARNVADGHGLVAYPGLERTEGYSNPLWVALLAGGWLLGVSPFDGAKILGALLAAACVPLTWAIAARLPVSSPRLARVVPMLAAALVATNAQHAIWASAGLENPLMTFLVALGTWRVLVEVERGGLPWAAVAFLGAALTRPEGVVYAAIGLGVGGWADLRAGRRTRVAASLATLALPLATYHVVRYAYFALPYPLTYYAKIADIDIRSLAWSARGWRYLRRWSTELGWVWAIPVLLAGVIGLRGRRLLAVAAWSAALAVALGLPEGWDDRVRVAALVLSGLALPVAALLGPGARVRVLLVAWAVFGIAFEVRAGGDWMNGFRFLAILTVPLAVMFSAGVAEVVTRLPRVVGPVVGAAIALAPVAVHVPYAVGYAKHPEMSPKSIGDRVKYYDELAALLHLDHPWVSLDHNQGGVMWWGPPHGRAIDSMGLTDIPFALHRRDQRYRRHFLLSPARFDFAWVHEDAGSMYGEKAFRDQFVRVPTTKSGHRRFRDAWVNRALLTSPGWPDEARRVDFEGGIHLQGFTVDAPEVAAGRGLYVEVGLSVDAPASFQLRLVLDGPATAVIELQPGYGVVFPPTSWAPGEVFDGRYAVAIPATLPVGTYALGFVVIGPEGTPLPVRNAPADAQVVLHEADGLVGEVRFPGVVRVVDRAEQKKGAEADVRRAQHLADEGDCLDAEAARGRAIHRDPRDARWAKSVDRRVAGGLAACWARKAEDDVELDDQIRDLVRARQWDVGSPVVAEVGARLADATWPLAVDARARDEHPEALRLFDAVATADPTRAWARRYAEDARVFVLKGLPGRD